MRFRHGNAFLNQTIDMFKNLTIRMRLVFVLAFLSLQLIIGGVIGIVSLALTNDAL